ncbi:E3 ubiquitin-protein ligase mind-bomb [Spatholobus suberectus]|nr:E3 ubiquitin-protein ligase mind-bomb [Spatholobus suberectus]
MSTYEIEGNEADNVDQFSVFRRCVLEGRWDYVIRAYRNNNIFHKKNISESRGTALHVAVNDGRVELVNILVDAILEHEGGEVLTGESALRSTNERGDTPLHLAASRGFIGMCKCIIGEHGERKDLIKAINDKGETPLFRAVLTCNKKTFVYLHHVSKDLGVSLRNNDGDTILHRAIWVELFDLAIIITDCYPGLLDTRNKDGATPLKVLACKPSAFKSGRNLPWWKQILYYCIPVGPVDATKALKSYVDKIDKSEELEYEVSIRLENEVKKERTLKKAHTFVERKYATSVRFAKSAVRLTLKGLSLSRLGVTTQDFKAIQKIKQKHKWSRQLLDVFMKTPSKSYMGNTGDQPLDKYDGKEDKDMTIAWETSFITQQQLEEFSFLDLRNNCQVAQ